MNFGDSPSYSGTSTFRGAQHPRLLSGSTEPGANRAPPQYGPKPILYPVPMDAYSSQGMGSLSSSSPYLAPASAASRPQMVPQVPYMIPPQPVAQKPIVQYVCNRGVAGSAAPTTAAPTQAAPPTPACSSCGRKSCGCPPSHRHHKCRMPARRMRDYEEEDDEEEKALERDRKKKRKSSKKSAITTAPPTISPYTANMLAPTGMGVVSSIMGAYGSGFMTPQPPLPPTVFPGQPFQPSSNLASPGPAAGNAYNALYGGGPVSLTSGGAVAGAGALGGVAGMGKAQNIAGVLGSNIAPAKFQSIPTFNAQAGGGAQAGGAQAGAQAGASPNSAAMAAASIAQQQSYMQQQMYMQQMMALQQQMQQPENQNPLSQQDLLQQIMALQQQSKDAENDQEPEATKRPPVAPATHAPDSNNPIGTGIITSSASVGDSMLSLKVPQAIQVGVFLMISNGVNSETFRIVKISPSAGIYIDQKVKGNYPAGTPVYFYNKMPKMPTISPVCSNICNSKCDAPLGSSVQAEYKYSDMCNCSYEVCGPAPSKGPKPPVFPDCSYTMIDGICNESGTMVSLPQLNAGQMPGTNCSASSFSSISSGIVKKCTYLGSTATPGPTYYAGTTTPVPTYYGGTTTPGPTYYAGTTTPAPTYYAGTTTPGVTTRAIIPTTLILHYPFDKDVLNYASGTGVPQGDIYAITGTIPIAISNSFYKTGTGSLRSVAPNAGSINSWFNVTTPDSTPIPSNNSGYSFSFWIYPTDSTSGMVFSMRTSTDLCIFCDISNGNIEVGTGKVTMTDKEILSPSNIITVGQANLNKWTHYAWTISPTGENKVYVNGSPVKLTGSVPYINGPITKAIILGDVVDTNKPCMVGYIDEFRYYDGIITLSDITNLPGIKFSPLIPGCSMWMDAADSSTIELDSQGYVSKWTDKSKPQSTIIFTQAVPLKRPKLLTDTTLNLPVVNFNSANKTYLGGPSAGYEIGTNCYALFMVFKYNDALSTGYIFNKSKSGTGDGRIITGRDNMYDYSNLNLFVSDSAHVNMNLQDGYTPNTYRIISMIYNRYSGLAAIYQNGAQIDRFTFTPNTTVNLTNAFNMIIGANNNDSGTVNPPKDGTYLSGSIAEIISYTNPYDMSDDVRQQIEGYLGTKWGLQSKLTGSGNPYSAIPPSLYVPFTPLQINNANPNTLSCLLWLDAADKSTYYTTASFGDYGLALWLDKSGYKNHFVTVDKAPQINLKRINNLPVVDFTSNSGNSYMRNQTIKMPPSCTIFVVGYTIGPGSATNPPLPPAPTRASSTGATTAPISYPPETINPTNNRLLHGIDFGSYPVKYSNLLFMGARNGNYISALGNGTTWADTGNSQSTALIANTPYNSVVSTTNANQLYLMSMANDGRYNIFRTYYNGSQMSTRNTSNVSYTGMTLGGKYDGTNISETWNGVICEVIIYNSLLTDAQRMQVDAYLAWKWGIRSSLPDANPYKNNM